MISTVEKLIVDTIDSRELNLNMERKLKASKENPTGFGKTEEDLSPIQQEKVNLRIEAKKTLKALKELDAGNAIKERSKAAVEKIQSMREFKNAETVMIYSALEDEIDLMALVKEHPEKTWVLPRAIGKGIMMLFEFKNSEELKVEKFGIKVPPGTNRLVSKHELDLILVPAFSFDKKGYRLGRGGGYYDKLISRVGVKSRKTKTIGVCFKELLKDTLPREEHDAHVNKILDF